MHRRVAALVRRAEWARVVPGVFDTGVRPTTTDPYDHRRRRSAVLGLLAHPGSVATGLCALVLHGLQGAPQSIRPEVALPGASPRSSTIVRFRRRPLERWDTVAGFPCATVADARGRRGAAGSAGYWAEADMRAESPAETWARLSCSDAGRPPDALQLVVVEPTGRFVARVDLAWLLPDGGALLVEIDGQEVHSTLDAVFQDRRRQNLLTGRGTALLRFTGRDAFRGSVGPHVRRALDESGWAPARWPPTQPFVLPT